MPRFPVYCPLSYPCDLARMYKEILATSPHWLLIPPTERFARHPAYFEVAGPEYYENCEYVEVKDNERVFHEGRRTWRGLNLRRHPEEESKLGLFSQRGKLTGWQWGDFDIPYTRQVIEGLPYTELEAVRIMTIRPGGFGPVHTDRKNDSLWEKKGHASTTFILRRGGVDMMMQGKDGVFTTPARVFFFKDSAPHGVPPVTAFRALLRVTGKVDYAAYRKLMDVDNAVWE